MSLMRMKKSKAVHMPYYCRYLMLVEPISLVIAAAGCGVRLPLHYLIRSICQQFSQLFYLDISNNIDFFEKAYW